MRFIRVGVPTLALMLGGLSALALGQDVRGSSGETVADGVCGGPPPCTVVNALADPASAGKDGDVVPFAEAIASDGRSAATCSKAAAAYDAAGVQIDAFLGPCPDARGVPSVADVPDDPDQAATVEEGAN